MRSEVDSILKQPEASLRAKRSNPWRRLRKAGLLRRGACHRARIRATRWLLAMTTVRSTAKAVRLEAQGSGTRGHPSRRGEDAAPQDEDSADRLATKRAVVPANQRVRLLPARWQAPGPIRRVARFERRCSTAFAPPPMPVVMGPCVRRDDAGGRLAIAKTPRKKLQKNSTQKVSGKNSFALLPRRYTDNYSASSCNLRSVTLGNATQLR
jgi:hypothetical protein